jgi:hypothetical protein
VDLLTRVVSLKPEGHYIYVSMGGKHLVDHEAVYRRLGIRNLYSFDGDAGVVARQQCNKPTVGAVCVELGSEALAGEIDSILHRFHPAGNLVIWLDYTKPAERLSQLQELTACLKKAQSGDVVRITMNAENYTLRGDWKAAGYDQPSTYRAFRLREQIAEYFDEKIELIGDEELPIALAKGVALACGMAEEERRLQFVPLLMTAYADGQRMMTATVLALAPGEQLPNGLRDWEFLAKRWTDVVSIAVPDLSLREKVAIDQHLSKGPAAIIKAVKFAPAGDEQEARQALLSYKRVHRFYPTFFPVGVQ